MPLIYSFKKGSDTAMQLNEVEHPWDASTETFTVHVDKSTGLIGKPSLKAVDSYDWRYLHGTTPDLTNRRYANKLITLSCWIEADSKQQLAERYDDFLHYFNYDDLILLSVTWATDNDNGGISPNPHESKGLYALVWLKGVEAVKHAWKRGKNYMRFTLVFEDPYPVKRIYRYSGGADPTGEGVDYDIVSETEIDIYADSGVVVKDILTGNGHLDIGFGYILVCGDVAHVKDSNGGDDIITPTGREDVTLIYEEL